MTCGEHDHPADFSDFEVVGFHHIAKRQPELEPFRNMEPGLMAEWDHGRWIQFHHDD